MSGLEKKTIKTNSEKETFALGERIGQVLKGGEVIELIGDVGSGKTAFTKGIAKGLSVSDDVQSPTFTISRIYHARDNLTLAHYDFYRLNDPGILELELGETVHDSSVVTIIEWGEIVKGVLGAHRLSVSITSPSDQTRSFEFSGEGKKWEHVFLAL